MWGGGSKEHPGKKRDPNPLAAGNSNFKLSQERWNT
jgi:hypothetical protein